MKKVLLLCLITLVTLNGIFANGNSENQDQNNMDKVYKLKLGHIQPVDHPNGQGAEEFARLVEEKTNGKVKVSVFPSSQLGTEQELFDSIAMGTIDFAALGYGMAAKQYSPFLIFDAPYLALDREQWVRIMNSDVIQEIYDGLEEKTDVVPLGAFYYGNRYLTTASFPVRKPADLNKHTVRVPDQKMYIDTLNSMGATATPMAFSEVFLSLQQGVIDAQENPLATIATNKFNEVQKYLNQTEHITGGNVFYASRKSLDKLPKEYQDAIIEAGKEAAAYTNKLAFEVEDGYKQKLQDQGMILVSDVDKEAFKEATKVVYADLEKDPLIADYLEKIRMIK
ncbi:MAG: TRAP transporter substrate-binding protein [Pleomorphochaeta sp.]